MLILTRRVGQSIVIGDSIKLTIHEAGKSKVKIGIEAPPEVSIHREEIYQRIIGEEEAEKPRRCVNEPGC